LIWFTVSCFDFAKDYYVLSITNSTLLISFIWRCKILLEIYVYC